MDIPEHVRAQLERIRAEGEQQIEKLRADAVAEALAMALRLRGSDADLIPLRLMCEHLALEAMHAEPLGRRKRVAHYETARVAVKNAKAAIRAGTMTPRNQGAGLPLDLARWCAEDETLRTLEEFMPHSRVMVRRSDARSWFESMGVDVPGFLHCKRKQAAPAEEVPADLEAPKQIGLRPKTGRMTEAKRAIRAILHAAGPALSRGAAHSFVMQAIRNGEVPSPFQMKEGTDESGRRVFVWVDTKGKEQELEPDTLKRYVREAWNERDQAPR
ncbi:MAG: hypothetical protein ACYCWL_00220 [Thauera sp.]